jgi:nicotinamidase-related amidase
MSTRNLPLRSPDSLPLPPYHEEEKVSQVWRVPYQERAEQARKWAEDHQIKPARIDGFKIAFLGIDLQNTFCIPDFELFVAGRSGMGAVEDCKRICEFIYRNLGVLTRIYMTMDTHMAVQIFHPIFLVDDKGEHPPPLTMVTEADIASGRWRFNPDIAESLDILPENGQEHLRHYTHKLKGKKKYDLTVWPYHAMLGGIGHALVSSVEQAVFFHTIARQIQAEFVVKGQLAKTESYSAIGPEVLEDKDGEQIARKDQTIIKLVEDYDIVIIAGEAKSHCVSWTIDDLLAEIKVGDEKLAQKVYLLEDCTSPVVVPGVVDYSDEADSSFQRFAEAGMHIVRSTDPIKDWLEG